MFCVAMTNLVGVLKSNSIDESTFSQLENLTLDAFKPKVEKDK